MPRPAAPEIEVFQKADGRDLYFEKDTDNLLNATGDDYGAVWFTVNPDSKELRSGVYSIRVTLWDLTNRSLLGEEVLTLTVIDRALPSQDTYYTNWFYVDCLCDLFEVEPYSNKFYRLFDEHIRNMTRHRQNTLLLPAFTPPLDTAVGDQRRNVQLVEVERTEGGWHFDFTKLRRYVRHAKRGGIRYFEHSHLFSQWGAKHAPNIYDREGNRIFGFDTDATSPEYVTFIRSYLTCFMEVAREEGIDRRLVFHLSDEPKPEHLESYRAAHDAVADLLAGNPICDAMNSMVFYRDGLVDQPICRVGSLEQFDGACPTKWMYYTGGVNEKNCTDRLVSNTAARTRVLGVQMYRYEAKGFLQWAYNYYYDRLSRGFADPRGTPNAYKMYAGVTYLCYPVMGRGGRHVVPSVREKLMAEAMDDLRALKALQAVQGRAATLALCTEYLGELGCETIPEGEALRLLRERVNAALADN